LPLRAVLWVLLLALSLLFQGLNGLLKRLLLSPMPGREKKEKRGHSSEPNKHSSCGWQGRSAIASTQGISSGTVKTEHQPPLFEGLTPLFAVAHAASATI